MTNFVPPCKFKAAPQHFLVQIVLGTVVHLPRCCSSSGRLEMFTAIRRASSRIRTSRRIKVNAKNSRAAVSTRPKTLGRYHRPLRRVHRAQGRRQSGRAARPIPRGRSFACRREACRRSGPWQQPLQYAPRPFIKLPCDLHWGCDGRHTESRAHYPWDLRPQSTMTNGSRARRDGFKFQLGHNNPSVGSPHHPAGVRTSPKIGPIY